MIRSNHKPSPNDTFTCIICGHSKFKSILRKDGWNIWRCFNCKLGFVYPQPTDEKLKKIYSLKGGYTLSSRGFEKEKILNIPDNSINYLLKNNKTSVLDVGCTSGAFVYKAKSMGLSSTGIDLDSDSIKFGIAEGLDLRYGTLETLGFKSSSFDAINLGDIIEHVKNPDSLLDECYRILKSEGIIIISTPNTNSFFPKATYAIYKIFGITWSHPTPPHHLFDFSNKNLAFLLEKKNFKIENITYSKIDLAMSIYKTGYYNNIREGMKGGTKKDIYRSVVRSVTKKIPIQLMVAFIYGIFSLIDRFFDKKGNQMVFYAKKSEGAHK